MIKSNWWSAHVATTVPLTRQERTERRRERARHAMWAGAATVAATVLVLGTMQVTRWAVGSTGSGSGAGGSVPNAASTPCTILFVPAYFYPGPEWKKMDGGKYVPRYIILDISGVGAGSGPVPAFQAAVKAAKARGIKVLGYTSTEYGDRPLWQVEDDVQNYKTWYGVTGVFLDEGSASAGELPYYEQLHTYINKVNPYAPIWLNVGTFPVRGYMAVANVIMTFEGPYNSFLNEAPAPAWAKRYSLRRFANNVYDTSDANWQHAQQLVRKRHVGIAYITDGTGSNPYSALPSYWHDELKLDHACRA